MEKTKQTKLMIIENFIDHITSNEEERKKLKDTASLYVKEDHVDEIEQAGFSNPKDLPTISKLDVQIKN